MILLLLLVVGVMLINLSWNCLSGERLTMYIVVVVVVVVVIVVVFHMQKSINTTSLIPKHTWITMAIIKVL